MLAHLGFYIVPKLVLIVYQRSVFIDNSSDRAASIPF
jgi:hypothetical protein